MDLNLVTVVVGAATALGTISMAISTYAHIRQERRQHGEIVQEGRRQHMDQFRPICVLVPPRPASILWKKGLNWSRRSIQYRIILPPLTSLAPTPFDVLYGI